VKNEVLRIEKGYVGVIDEESEDGCAQHNEEKQDQEQGHDLPGRPLTVAGRTAGTSGPVHILQAIHEGWIL
jgi:hypothetical protein